MTGREFSSLKCTSIFKNSYIFIILMFHFDYCVSIKMGFRYFSNDIDICQNSQVAVEQNLLHLLH